MEKQRMKTIADVKTQGQKGKIPPIYPVIDTDLARDNLENDIPAADLQDLKE